MSSPLFFDWNILSSIVAVADSASTTDGDAVAAAAAAAAMVSTAKNDSGSPSVAIDTHRFGQCKGIPSKSSCQKI